MNKKNILFGLASGVLAAGLLTGCSGEETEKNTEDPAVEENTEDTGSETEKN